MNLEVTLGNTKTGTEKARCNTSNTKAEKVQGYEIHSSTKATCLNTMRCTGTPLLTPR